MTAGLGTTSADAERPARGAAANLDGSVGLLLRCRKSAPESPLLAVRRSPRWRFARRWLGDHLLNDWSLERCELAGNTP